MVLSLLLIIQKKSAMIIKENNYEIGGIIDLLVRDRWLYCFQDDYGILGIPTKRLLLTTEAIRLAGKIFSLDENKQTFIQSFACGLSDSSQHLLILWK